MLSMAVNGYLAADVLYALRGIKGRRDWAFRYELLNSSNAKIGDLTNILSCSIDHDAEAEVKRTAKFTVRDDGSINYLSNRIKPWARIKMPDGGYAEWPLGVFLLTSPNRKIDVAGVLTRDVDAYDQALVCQDDNVSTRYYVANNYLYTDAINELLAGITGLGGYSITTSTLRLPAALEWDPGTTKFKIINDLLAAINYTGLWFDGAGVARATPYVSPAAAASAYTYATDAFSVVVPEAEQTIDIYGVPNRWVLLVSTPDRPTLRSVITNTNPLSATSTVSRGRTITKVVLDDAVNQTTLDARAAKMMELDSLAYSVYHWQTGLMPVHEYLDIVTLDYPDMNVSNVKLQETRWSMDLSQGAVMDHTARVAVPL